MPALSFQEEWLLKLLNGTKQQTTRPLTDRIKVGDIVNVYNQQRRRVIDKPLMDLTKEGIASMPMNRYPFPSNEPPRHYAHFLGKIKITEVLKILPSKMSKRNLEEWAWADGFQDFATARCWFEIRYGARWMHQTWTVIRWDGWQERYFEPGE